MNPWGLPKLFQSTSRLNMESGSPWSTPTQSEIGEAENQLKYLSDIDLKLGVEQKLMVRELGDGEPCENSMLEETADRDVSPVRNDSVKSSKNMSLVNAFSVTINDPPNR